MTVTWIVVVSVTATFGVLLWTAGFHAGWRKARMAEVARVRERQRKLGERAVGRPRRSTRL